MFFIVVVIVLTILIFAIVGFVTFLMWLFRSGSEPSRPVDQKPTVAGDVQASRRLIDYLRSSGEIDSQMYLRLRGLLETNFPEQFEAPTRRELATPQRESAGSDQSTSPVQEVTDSLVFVDAVNIPEDAVNIPEDALGIAKSADSNHPDSSGQASPRSTTTPTGALPDSARPQPPIVGKGPGPSVQPVRIPAEAGVDSSIADAGIATRPAPWDLPDPPSKPPRRTFAELMSGFMQEKNMRWGELTSGILIVLSAVGLVVSLREQLRDTIPYFTSLLFMLMTAAIHGAGIYTLKKWKLRNTSRGTLIIGLLLVPLNFVAACVLSERRALNEPWLWIAIIIGLTGFTAMTWWSSKCLLRRGQLSLTAAVIGCGVGALIINRTVEFASSSFLYLLCALPVAISFLIGTCAFDPRQWVRERWTERTRNRVYLVLGVSVFAAVTALSLVVIRADTKLMGLVAITPVASLICIVTSWLGSMLVPTTGLTTGQIDEDSIADGVSAEPVVQSVNLPGLTLKILGLILLVFSLLASASNPTVLVMNAFVSSLGLAAMFLHQREEHLIPIAWGILAAGLLMAVNLAVGTFGIDQWASNAELWEALVNGKSGLCLLLVGIGVAGGNTLLQQQVPWLRDNRKFRIRGWLTGGSIFVVGCLVALIASLLHREDQFDVMVASGLLGVAAIGLLAVCVIADRRQIKQAIQLPHFAAILLLGALAHLLLWNPVVATWARNFTQIESANWVWMFAIHSMTLVAMVNLLRRWQPRTTTGESGVTNSSAAGFLNDWAAGSTLVLSVGALTLVPYQTGWATGLMAVACINWFLVGHVWTQTESEQASFAAAPFIAGTALLVSLLIAELVSRFSWCPPTNLAAHIPVQIVGLSLWAIAVSIGLAICYRKPNLSWLSKSNFKTDQFIMAMLVLVAGGLVVDSLVSGAAAELSSETQIVSQFLMADATIWMNAALIATGVALLIAVLITPTTAYGFGLVLIWLLVWAFGANHFADSKSVASALRWLLPIGGLAGAFLVAGRRLLVPAWSALRSRLNLPGRSRWPSTSTQQLINFALLAVAGTVLLVSTITVSQVLLKGGDSLGGPAANSWFRQIPTEISFGLPVAIVVGTFLLFAISESRAWLATIGSMVFQYIVLLAVVLLFLSPHPKLASTWFINILKSVSIGMTGYGFIWFWFRIRIEGKLRGSSQAEEVEEAAASRWWLSQIEVHTLINGLLITSLAALAMVRFYFVPDQPGGWISSFGSPLGAIAWALFGVLAFSVWRNHTTKSYSIETWAWLVGWMGLILVGLAAAVIDRSLSAPEDFVAWLPFRVVMFGAGVIALIQTGMIFWMRNRQPPTEPVVTTESNQLPRSRNQFHLAWPILVSGSLALLYATRGALVDTGSFWLYLAVMVALTVLTTGIGWMLRDGKLGFVSAAVGVLAASLVVWRDPAGWFSGNRPDWLNLTTVVLAVLAIAWTVFYILLERRRQPVGDGNQTDPPTSIPRGFTVFPNLVMLASSGWILLAALGQFLIEQVGSSSTDALAYPLGISALISALGLAVIMLWNPRARLRVLAWCVLTTALAILIASIALPTDDWRAVGVVAAVALIVSMWGVAWLSRSRWFDFLGSAGAPKLELLENSMRFQLPVYTLLVGSVVILFATGMILSFEERSHRYVIALIPFMVAIGLGAQSNPAARRWLQMLTLGLVTLGALFLSWADLTALQMTSLPTTKPLIRTLIVLAAAMFVHGGLVARWVREGDTWLKSLRQMAVITCGLAIISLVLVLISEASSFREGVGCGLPLSESAAVAVLVAGMIVGLVVIAMRPQNDPFALSLQGRMGYVYAAEFVGAALIAHMYFSMPFLFQFGIKAYWPYLAMAICFGGVGIAHVLENRQLTVLGQPLFNTAVVLPLIVAIAIFAVDSKAEPELVMLTIGLAYLMISFTHKSLLSGVAGILFGNAALWMVFNRAEFVFHEHPQLWLIPPAVSTLIAGQLSRHSLTNQQLSMLRYVCVIVIYVSSTMEIFIGGVGENLWPPLILAILSVAGIMSGIMFRVKSFLYFGSLFLLMAMITMVAHAQQRLEHVWPWWAFGIGLGIAILVMFGLFEKKKNEMTAIADQLKEWEA